MIWTIRKRPFSLLVLLAILWLSGCGAESPTPTPFVPTQAALVPVEPGQSGLVATRPVMPLATPMSLVETAVTVPPTAVSSPPTAVIPTFIPPTITIEVPAPTVTIVPTIPIGTQFSNLRFAPDVDAVAQNTYPVGANGIVVLWDYTNMNLGDFVQRDWKFNGERWLYREEFWDDEETERGVSGTVTDVELYGEVIGGLAPGDYYLDLFINGVWQTGGGFTVLARPTDGEPNFNNLHFTAYANGPAQTSFPAGIEQVYAVWNYGNLGVTDVVKREWTLNGEPWQAKEETWDYFHYGPVGVVSDVSVYNFEEGGLSSGSYLITVYLNGEQQLEGAFTIGN